VRVMVTGGAGYIGSHTARLLVESGHHVVVLDNLSRGHLDAVRGLPFVQADVGDRRAVVEALGAHRIDSVVHFAAFAYVGESVEKPELYFRNNVVETLGLLEAMREADVRRLVFSSSCATYGVPERVPIDEAHPQRPVNPYGETKLFVEKMLDAFGHAHGLRWVALRYFNAAGAHPDGTMGEDHEPETHLIPNAINTALGRNAHLDVFGTDYATADGTAVRDYIHVLDLARAHAQALVYLSNDGASLALNLGTGQGASVAEVIGAVERLAGGTVARRDRPRRRGDPPALVADARRAHEVLGWTPEHSSLDTIIETALRHHRRRTH
jgi:UDP-arabinose 4-epimerase